jgi:predicted nucleic acid-binding protein
MTSLLDTTILIDLLRGSDQAEGLLLDLLTRRERVWAAVPTRTEVIRGVRDDERARMSEVFGLLAWVDTDSAIADKAGELARRYGRTHPGVGTVDYLIAATAMAIGARLVTSNVRHFPMFEGLQPAYR